MAAIDAEIVDRELAERSLREFVAQAWPVVSPGIEFLPNWHIDAICEHLQAVSDGKIRRLIINVPPRCMKSITTAVMWPAWDWIRTPSRRWLFSSYAQSLSTRDSVACRWLIRSPWYQARWGNLFALTGDQDQKTRFANSARGYRLATSVGGANTGEGGDIVAIDDAHNAAEWASVLSVAGVADWWDTSMCSRLNDPRTGAFVFIMQRVAENDLVGHVLAKELGWEHLCLPMRAEGSEHPTPCRTSLHFADPRKPGELLWPTRFGEDEVRSLEVSMTARIAAGQLQQRPSPAGGDIFHKTWFKHFAWSGGSGGSGGGATADAHTHIQIDGQIFKLAELEKFATVDVAVSEKESADYTVIGIWAIVERVGRKDLALIDLVRARMQGPDIVPAIGAAQDKWNFAYAGVESNGAQVIHAQAAARSDVRVRELQPGLRKKTERALASTPAFEQGRVWFPPASTPWIDAVESELLAFPDPTVHDDTVDVCTYAVVDVLPEFESATPSKPGKARSKSAFDRPWAAKIDAPWRR